MNWNEIKQQIVMEYHSPQRRLESLKTRLRGIDSIEQLLPKEYKLKPSLFLEKGKSEVEAELTKIKKLNGAENTSLNAIYHVLEGKPIPIKKRKSD